MIKQKIAYLILLIVAICFFVLYEDLLSFILLISLIAYPLAMLAVFSIVKKRCTAAISAECQSCLKNRDIVVKVNMKNRTIFPVPNTVLNLKFSNSLSENSEKVSFLIPWHANKNESLKTVISSKCCGKLVMKIENICIYDYIKLFKFKIKPQNPTAAVIVMPDAYPLDAVISNSLHENHESDSYSKIKSGDDPSEVFNIREYSEGDKINRIHWKLSSKTDKMMVKEYSLPITCNTLIMPELILNNTCTPDDFDSFMDTLASLSQFFAENNTMHTVMWYDSSSNNIINYTVDGTSDSALMLRKLLSSDAYHDKRYVLDNYLLDELSGKYAHAIYLTFDADETAVSQLSSVYPEVRKTIVTFSKNIVFYNDETEIINVKSGFIQESFSEFVL